MVFKYIKTRTLMLLKVLVFPSIWWLQRESNQRHRDFQSLALPTELWSQMAVSTGLEPAIFCVTGRRVNQLHHETKWLREEDLNLWPLGYEPNELPNCSIPRYIWRRKRDSNPCADCSTSWFSRPVPSTRLGYSSINFFPSNKIIIAYYFYLCQCIFCFFNLWSYLIIWLYFPSSKKHNKKVNSN